MLYNKQLRLVQERDFKGNWEKRFYVEQPPEALPGGGPNEVYPALLQRLLYEAAGSDHILQPGELLDYAKAYPVELRPMAIMLHDNLEIKSTPLKSVTQDDVNQVFGLRKYLKEFTLSNERTLEEVYLWKGYLVFATLYGNADQVRKDMKAKGHEERYSRPEAAWQHRGYGHRRRLFRRQQLPGLRTASTTTISTTAATLPADYSQQTWSGR